MNRIPLRNREGLTVAYALVDDEDFDALNQFSWFRTAKNYAGRSLKASDDPKRHTIYMHRAICGLGPGAGMNVDHINGDQLDNRRQNLRVCSHKENLQNRHRVWGTSRFRGVHWNAREKRWIARVMLDGKQYTLGRFTDEEQAAAAASAFRAKHMPYSEDALAARRGAPSLEINEQKDAA